MNDLVHLDAFLNIILSQIKLMMKKSINIKDFIQMMPVVSPQLSDSRNWHSKHEQDPSKHEQTFLSTIKTKIKRRKLVHSEHDSLHQTLFVKRETGHQKSQSSQLNEWLQEENLLRQKMKTMEIKRKKKEPKQTFKAAKIRQFEISVENNVQDTINPQQFLSLNKKDKLNPFQLFLRKKNMIKMKVKFNKLSLSTEIIKQELRSNRSKQNKKERQCRQARRYLFREGEEESLALSGHQTTKFKSRTLHLQNNLKNAKTQVV